MTDTERLDWLIEAWATIYHQEGGPHWVVVNEKKRLDRRGVLRDDLRAAIDAAAADER